MRIESSEPVNNNLDVLFETYGDMIYRLALVRTKSIADAEDVVQEVFLRCLRSNPVFQSAEHQKAWLIKVALNCSKTLLGSAFRRHSVPEDAMGELSSEDETPDSTVYDAVMKLPEKYRTAIHLYYYEDYSVKEIAAVMRTTESTVKSWLHRARGMLKEMLGGDYEV
ncbi:MAG: RNA polymerase sigma factor [Clostridia bacterium]|nr:RNA polymerase sigma factor [Clostridia bacterium]